MLREIKPKNARSARALAKRAPLANENPKKILFLRSTSSSSLVNSIVGDLFALKRPLAVRFSKKNTIHPFEDPSSLEFFSEKNDTSLLCLASHSKKRPHSLTFVRCYGAHIFDMLECSVVPDTARVLAQFSGPKCRVGIKPLLSFSGMPFEETSSGDRDYSKFSLAKSMFIDFFRGEEAKDVDVEGLQMMISFIARDDASIAGKDKLTDDVISMRTWRIRTKRSGQKLPRIEVEEMGPRIDFRLGRLRVADQALWRAALEKDTASEARVKKNIGIDGMGDKTGRIHLGRQNIDEMQARKMKGLKRSNTHISEHVDDDDVNASQEDLHIMDKSDVAASNVKKSRIK